MRLSAFLALGFAAALIGLSQGGATGEPGRTHDITLDDYFTLATITDAALAPDGQHVAFAEARWQEPTNDRKADLWVVATATGAVSRLTFDRAADRELKWAPDGRHLYVLANRRREGASGPPYDGTTQVWRGAPRGGEPPARTRGARGGDPVG